MVTKNKMVTVIKSALTWYLTHLFEEGVAYESGGRRSEEKQKGKTIELYKFYNMQYLSTQEEKGQPLFWVSL